MKKYKKNSWLPKGKRNKNKECVIRTHFPWIVISWKYSENSAKWLKHGILKPKFMTYAWGKRKHGVGDGSTEIRSFVVKMERSQEYVGHVPILVRSSTRFINMLKNKELGVKPSIEIAWFTITLLPMHSVRLFRTPDSLPCKSILWEERRMRAVGLTYSQFGSIFTPWIFFTNYQSDCLRSRFCSSHQIGKVSVHSDDRHWEHIHSSFRQLL